MSHKGDISNLKWATSKYVAPPDAVLAHIRARMVYDEVEGAVNWSPEFPKPYRTSADGKVGTIRADGYRMARVGKYVLPLTRIAWFLSTGSWPSGVIRTINGDPLDLKMGNLVDTGDMDNISAISLQAMEIADEATQKAREQLWHTENAPREIETGRRYFRHPQEREAHIAREIKRLDEYANSSVATLMGNVVPEAERRSTAEAMCDAQHAQRVSVDRELRRLGFNPPADTQSAYNLLEMVS